jgi:hypothetical protein
MSQESLLKKEFKSRDVNRARNLVNKDFSAKTVDGVGYTKAQVAYTEGDIWEENGRTWTIKNGLRQNITKLDQAKKALQIPLACPKCKGSMSYHLSQKMYKIHGMCYDCVVDYEGKLRVAGLYDQYEKSMIQGGLKAFARDIEAWVMESIDQSDSYVTEQGDVESWKNNDSDYRKKAIESLQDYLMHIKKHIDS